MSITIKRCIFVLNGETSTHFEETDFNNLLKEILKALELQLGQTDNTNRRLFRRNITMKTIPSTTHGKKYYWQQWAETTTIDSNIATSTSDYSEESEVEQKAKSRIFKSNWFESNNISKNKTFPDQNLDQLMAQIKYKELLVKTNDEFISYLDKSVEEMEYKMRELDQQIKNGYRELNSSWDVIVQAYNRTKTRREAIGSNKLPINTEKFGNTANDFSKMVANLVEVKKKNLQAFSNPNSYWAVQSYGGTLPSRRIRAVNRKGGNYHEKKNKHKPTTVSEEEEKDEEDDDSSRDDEEEVEGSEEEKETSITATKDQNKSPRLGKTSKRKKVRYEDKVEENEKEGDDDNNNDNHEDDNVEETGDKETVSDSAKNFFRILFTSLKKFVPFTKKNRGSYIESSLPLDITYRLNDEMEPQLAHVTICVKDDLTTSEIFSPDSLLHFEVINRVSNIDLPRAKSVLHTAVSDHKMKQEIISDAFQLCGPNHHNN